MTKEKILKLFEKHKHRNEGAIYMTNWEALADDILKLHENRNFGAEIHASYRKGYRDGYKASTEKPLVD